MLSLPGNWQTALAEYTAGAVFQELSKKVAAERGEFQIFPAEKDTFRALALTDLTDVKIVILGQDPYHGEGQAHGLAFSVPEGITLPPSLRNIYKELATEYNWDKVPESGDLTKWAKQGVLLLNTVLTVRAHQANSHAGLGWEGFTDEVIKVVNQQCSDGVIFMLWGNPAQKKRRLIDEKKHYVLSCAHPSPLSAYRGFFGSNIFIKTNELLALNGRRIIEWYPE